MSNGRCWERGVWRVDPEKVAQKKKIRIPVISRGLWVGFLEAGFEAKI